MLVLYLKHVCKTTKKTPVNADLKVRVICIVDSEKTQTHSWMTTHLLTENIEK